MTCLTSANLAVQAACEHLTDLLGNTYCYLDGVWLVEASMPFLYSWACSNAGHCAYHLCMYLCILRLDALGSVGCIQRSEDPPDTAS